MKAFDIQNSIVGPFAKLPLFDQGQKPQYNSVQNYASRNLPCGNINFGNLGTLMNAADLGIQSAKTAIASVLAVVDLGIQVGLEVMHLAAKTLDMVDKLIGKIQEFDLSDKLDQIDLKLKDLGVKLFEGGAKAIKDLVSGIGTAIKQIGDACKKLLKAFDTNSDMGEILEDPIGEIADLLACKAGDVLGMLAMGLTGLSGNSAQSSGFSNPLSGVMGAVNGTISTVTNAVGGVVGAVNGAVNGVTGTVNGVVNGITSQIPGPVKAIISGINPKAGQFLQQNGVASIINTALGSSIMGDFSTKTLTACMAAQRLNRFGNYNPFINEAMSIPGLSGANSQLAQAVYNVAMNKNNNVSCDCCRNETRYTDRDSYVNLATKMFDRRDNYYQSNTPANGIAPVFRTTYDRLPEDITTRTIASYGFDEQNLLSQNLGTTLEGIRITNNLSGNLSEASTDFSKINDFADQVRSNMGYLSKLGERNMHENLAMKEDMEEVDRELDVSALTQGYPFTSASAGSSPDYPIFPSYASGDEFPADKDWLSIISDEPKFSFYNDGDL